MKRRLGLSFAAAVALALPSAAAAQQGSFVLFGKQSEDMLSLSPERRVVHPVTAPYFHEDSFVTTDVRAWYAYHSFPKSIALNGGDAHVYAAQARLALTDRIQFVAYKDGYVDLDSGLIKESGWNDLAAGLKFALYQDWKNDFHISAGVGYQFAVGDAKVLQNDQEARVWASVNKGFGPLHLGATVNYLKHTGSQGPLGASDRIIWHLHADYYVNKYFSPVVELNGYHSVNDGNEVLPFSGADIANLGGGDDLVTLGLGLEIRPIPDIPLALRAAYETDLTSGDNLYGYRWTFSVLYSF
ncbi:MAG: hypothetical protein ACK4PI_13400 [Tepidisphaerales bacterium]